MTISYRIAVIDSHTAGEPTRVVMSGGPDLGAGSLAERRERFRRHHDAFRSAVITEPRGSDVLVGALLCEPSAPNCAAGIIFFNNVGFLGMCGHGAIGVAVTLGHLGRIGAGQHLLETPVGMVPFEYDGAHRVTLENVPSYRHAARVPVAVTGIGTVVGDIAWGGNWFFLVSEHGETLELSNVRRLTELTCRIRSALRDRGITGRDGAEIDHIELFGPPSGSHADSRNFVLCPGLAFDRSPCGTGTSAKLACLVADGKLAEGQVWRQESIIGSVFETTARIASEHIVPRITGAAYICAEATLLLDPDDPLAMGIRTRIPQATG